MWGSDRGYDSPGSPSSSCSSQIYISSGCRLPPCDTEVFSGDYLRWPTLRHLLTAIYINNPGLTPVEKLFHLNAKTSGDAHTIVSNSPFTNDGFRSAWANLTERFENKQLLVNGQLKIRFNVQSVNQESGSAIRELHRTIQGCLTALEMSGIEIENWDCLFVYMCSSKLPKLTLSFWEHSLVGADVLPSILLSGTRPNICGSLLGQETIFGWILTGPVPAPRENQISVFFTRISHTVDTSLDRLLTKFWEVEDLPVRVTKSSDLICA